MADVVAGTIIASTISTVAGQLAEKLRAALGSAAAPDTDLLSRAIELICSAGGFDLNHLTSEATPETVQMWLRKLLRTSTDMNPTLNKDNISNLFGSALTGRRCFGAPNGTAILPSNRPTLSPPAGGRQVDFLYDIDESTIPTLPGFNKADFEELVQGAWDRWTVNSTKLTVQRATNNDANLTVSFGVLDGTGSKLAETTNISSGGVQQSSRILIDIAEDWTKSKLLSVVTHEIGHSLGLNHVPDPAAIMAEYLNPSYNGVADLATILLKQADITALNATQWV